MDPKYSSATERLLTVYITYLVTKYAKLIPGLDQSMVPDLVVLVMGLGMALYGAIHNTKIALLSRVASMPEVRKVELSPVAPSTPALADATPANVVVGNTH